MFATTMLCRRSLGRRILPLAVGVSVGSLAIVRTSFQAPLMLDTYRSPPETPLVPQTSETVDDSLISPEFLRQLSGGSMAGFISGLLVSVFSRTLVLLIGITIVTFQVAAKYGIDLAQQLKLKDRVESSRILPALRDKTPFKLSFGLTFAMSAFMHF